MTITRRHNLIFYQSIVEEFYPIKSESKFTQLTYNISLQYFQEYDNVKTEVGMRKTTALIDVFMKKSSSGRMATYFFMIRYNISINLQHNIAMEMGKGDYYERKNRNYFYANKIN